MPASSDPTGEAVTRTVTLARPLHARPAGQVAQLAARHQGTTIELSTGAKRANARSVLAVMGLGAPTGSTIEVRATGPDAAGVVDEIEHILTTTE